MFFLILSLKLSVYFITHLNYDAKFSSEILDLYLDYIKFNVEEVGSFIYPSYLNISKFSIMYQKVIFL